jgi:hypothetical protein
VWVRGVGVRGIAYDSMVDIKDGRRMRSVSERTQLMCISWELSRVGADTFFCRSSHLAGLVWTAPYHLGSRLAGFVPPLRGARGV